MDSVDYSFLTLKSQCQSQTHVQFYFKVKIRNLEIHELKEAFLFTLLSRPFLFQETIATLALNLQHTSY